MSKNTCKMAPEVTTPKRVETSRLFLDLVDKKKLHYSRDLALTIYANYLNSNIEEQMEAVKKEDGSPKYVKNRQGQFNAKDVVEFLDIEKHLEEINKLTDEEFRIGATESKGGPRIDYTDAEEVLNKVNDFNNTHKRLVAVVDEEYTSEGEPFYNIVVYENNHRTISYPVRTRERLQAWKIYKQVFNSIGVDIVNVPTELKSVFNANNIGLDHHLKNIASYSIDDLYKKDAITLLYIDKDSKYTKRLIDTYGSIEEAAQVLDDWNHGNKYASKEERHLISMAINHAKELHGIDIRALIEQIDKLQSDIRSDSIEIKLEKEIKELDKKYNIGLDVINDYLTEIKSLSDANRAAIAQLKREASELRKEKGRTKDVREVEALRNKLTKELSLKHYYSGMIDYLKKAGEEIPSINEILKSVPQSGDSIERLNKEARAIQAVKTIKAKYYDIVRAIAKDNITMDEVDSQRDIDNIKQRANELLDIFDREESKIKELTKNFIKDLLRVTFEGKIKEFEIQEVVDRAVEDVSWLDSLFYSFGTSNNLVVATLGKITRNAETLSTEKLKEFQTKVDRANDKLYRAGYDSKFMYENQKHIISDIDWEMYDSAKKEKRKSLIKQGFKDFDLQEAMEEWEDLNTEDRLVDKVNNRYERVPGKLYRKKEDFQKDWSPEQKEYYEVMMEYKGELETLYPSYAQNYYLPPQIRRNFTDAIVDARSLKDVKKAIGNKIKDLYTIREDDTNYVENSIVDGSEARFVEGDYDNTPKKSIPIYFQKTVEQGELLLDFSSAIMHEASSSFRYDALNSIKDTAETVKDLIGTKPAAAPGKEAEMIADTQMIKITQSLHKWGKKNNVSNMLNGFVDQHFYGIKRSSSDLNHKILAKLVDSTIAYTSFKGLATNVFGAFSNMTMGLAQIFIDTHSGEFFGYGDVGRALLKVFGKPGIPGEVMDIATNNVHSKAKLLQNEFDPMQENFEEARNKRYYHSRLRHLFSTDLSFMLYGGGEHLIHLIPMYAILLHQKVKLNGETISLYDAYEVEEKDHNSILNLKEGVTDLKGNPITQDYIEKIKNQIRYVNSSMHGAMNDEEKGLIHQYMLGRLAVNFKQWMVAHYSRRFRGKHIDDALGDWREGYYRSVWNFFFNDDTKDAWNAGHKGESIWLFAKDLFTFIFRSTTQMSNLDEMQRYNIDRARAEICLFFALVGLEFVLGEPEDHKKEYWRRWWIYQNKRMFTETEASMPIPTMITNGLTVMNSPMAGINTLNSLLYAFYGIGDITENIKSGPHKGENRYLRNICKYDLPFFKDWERLQTLDADDSIFKVFENSPSNH